MLIISPAGHFLGAINRPPTHDSPLTALPYHLLSPVFPCSCLTAFLFPPHRSRLTPHRFSLIPFVSCLLFPHRVPTKPYPLLTPDFCLLSPIPYHLLPITSFSSVLSIFLVASTPANTILFLKKAVFSTLKKYYGFLAF